MNFIYFVFLFVYISQAVLETVARVTRDKPKRNDTKEEK